MPANPLSALASAAEGSRELDALVAVAAGWKQARDGLWNRPEDVAEARRQKIGMLNYRPRPLPAFTTSVDAALTLVPDGWDFVECNSNGNLWFVVLGYGDHCHPRYREAWSWPGEERDRAIFHRKPFPLAIVLASLRAREAAP